MARRRRSGGRKRAKFGRKTKHNLMLMRTRNLGVVGTRGAGVIAHTKGPFISLGGASPDLDFDHLVTEHGHLSMVTEDRTANIIPE